MLILSRKIGETVVIDGQIRVKIVRLEGDAVKIGIEAPASVSVHRQEIYDEIQQSNKQAVTAPGAVRPAKLQAALPRLQNKPTTSGLVVKT
jgi:carbon storage regulator